MSVVMTSFGKLLTFSSKRKHELISEPTETDDTVGLVDNMSFPGKELPFVG